MKFRKKHKNESEVFTDSLNDILFILLMFFLIVATLANPNVVKVNAPRGSKDTKTKQNIMVSIDKDQNFYLGGSKTAIPLTAIDSLIIREIIKYRSTRAVTDTPSVVINADTAAFYGEVYRIMRLAKKEGAKVVAVVK